MLHHLQRLYDSFDALASYVSRVTWKVRFNTEIWKEPVLRMMQEEEMLWILLVKKSRTKL